MKLWIAILCCFCLLSWTCASDRPKYVALTFDDGPSGRFTEELLDFLEKKQVPATFFLCGYRVEQYPHLTKRIAMQGHEIGVHSDQHRFFSRMTEQEICLDLAQTRQKIVQAAHKEPTLLRPPGGIYDLDILSRTCCNDLPVILWSVDVQDWCRSNSTQIANDIVKQAKSGDIILMHDMKDSSINAAKKVIESLQARGFEFLTVSELADLCGIQLMGSTVYYSFVKKLSICVREQETEPCAKFGFPPPRPFSSALSCFTVSRTSPCKMPTA